MEKAIVVTPWYREDLREQFLEAWRLTGREPFLHMEQDSSRAGCGVTKNRGVRAAMDKGAEIVVVLDDDCYPSKGCLESLIASHVRALEPQPVPMIELTTTPAARGTPYQNRTVTMPVAASMGFWNGVPDFDACGQLVNGVGCHFRKGKVFGRYFALCGMNLAFRPADWLPWCEFIDVSRFDDIWMGWLWEREAYRRGFCFNLGAADEVYHARASNVWANLRDEARFLEENDTLWREIHSAEAGDYESLRGLLPV